MVFHLFIASCTVRLNYVHLSILGAVIATAVAVYRMELRKSSRMEAKGERARKSETNIAEAKIN